jgi:hypothetical protein
LPVDRCYLVSKIFVAQKKIDLRGNTSGTEFSVAETAGQLGDGVTGTGQEVEEEGGGDISAGRVLDLLEGGSETVLVGAESQLVPLNDMVIDLRRVF